MNNFNPDVYPQMGHLKGPSLAGFIFTAVLYGANVSALFSYIQFSWKTDRKGTRILVLAVGFVATLSMVFLLYNTLRLFAVNFGQPPSRQDSKLDSFNYALEGCMHVMVAGYFARRCWKMWGRHMWMAVGLGLLLAATAAGTIGAFATGITAGLGNESTIETVSVLTMIISQLGGDIILSCLIVVKLLMSKTGFQSTDTMLHRLVLMGIETQAPPALLAIAFLVTFLTAKYPSYPLAFVCYPNVYAMSLLAALNARYTISAKLQAETESNWHVDRERRSLPMHSINVHTETFVHADMPDHLKKRTPIRGAGISAPESTDSLQDHEQDTKDLNTSEIRLVVSSSGQNRA